MTEFDVHEDPLTFIQVIGRFASMVPAGMGYDVRFSNAGRVLANEKIRTVLEIFPAPVMPCFGGVPAGDDAADSIKVDLLVENPLFTPRGLLFSRFIQVWEGHEVYDGARWSTGPLQVPSVAKVLGSQSIEGTANRHQGIAPDDVLGAYQIVISAAQPSQSDSGTTEGRFQLERRDGKHRLSERALVRIVFEQKGGSIYTAQDCKELLQATRHWVEGLQGLQEKGITHRDISSGNLLLGPDPNSRAFMIDLGLADFDSKEIVTVSDSRNGEGNDARGPNHVIGTLPFISHQILEASVEGDPLLHTFYHDLESILWVLVHHVLQEEHSNLAKAKREALLSTNLHEVLIIKQVMLSDAPRKLKFSGRFKDLEPFLKAFAEACWDHHKCRRNLESQSVIEMVDRALQSLSPSSVEAIMGTR
ncbi:hypothetical protein M407DRAFT_28412 [Tulasnella calospora MUT 4182]|uniref:Fungal-type protein kinase domain-containing protein n=1 Tax=Tulasnella calospora MUT 4182 TaxID=1051891 RepID=A0A0C3QC07_9AGAM|nr:hypothetical protein M407DRAFT_28412 [Tulasnella calospora MUT 4182]